MAIDFKCPHCQTPYRLKDEFAGKRATCRNPECRKVIVVPTPATVPPSDAARTVPQVTSPAAPKPAAPTNGTPAPKPAAPAPVPANGIPAAKPAPPVPAAATNGPVVARPAAPAAKPTPPAAPAAKPAAASAPPAAKPAPAPKPTPPATKPAAPPVPPPPPVDVEAAALSALADAPQEEAAADTPIAVTCDYCDHKWTEPREKAGKNVLCPNPECRQRVKVPVPKDDKPTHWRDAPKGPSLAKENFEKPKDVVDAEAKVVSKEAWVRGGGAEQDLEPIPLSRRLFVGTLIATPPVALVAGGVYWWQTRTRGKNDQLMADALKEFAAAGAGSLPPAEALLYSALLETAAGEYELRETAAPDKALKRAKDHFTRARDDLRKAAAQKDDPKRPTAATRNMVGCELAVATLGLGGTDEQVTEQTRYRWVPQAPTGRNLRINEKTYDVHTELQRTLELLQPAEFDLKAALARRLTRELAKRNQPGLAADIPVMLFTEPEQAEAKAVVGLELFRHDKGSAVAQQIAGELKTQLAASGNRNPVPASAQTLWAVAGTEKPPTVVVKPQGGPFQEASRYAYVGVDLLQDKPDTALELAKRPGGMSGQLRALTLYADWTADPTPALDAALAALNAQAKGKKDVGAPPYVVLRLVQIAAAAGKAEQAKALTEFLTDDGLKAWATADAVRVGASKTPVDETAVEAPDDPKALRAGHAWGRFWVARHNTRLSGNRTKEAQAVAAWPKGTIHPFGLAGVALGLKDQ